METVRHTALIASLPIEVHYESARKRLKINDKSGDGIENNAVISTR